jgi:hypothetical protein
LTRDKGIVPTALGIPNRLEINDKILTWEEVENAERYIIYIDGEEKPSENASYSLDELIEIRVYEIKVKAIGDGKKYLNSKWSEIIKHTVSTNLTAPKDLQIEGTTLKWTAVKHAASYMVWINGDNKGTVESTEYSLGYLTETGVYEIKIKAIGDGEIYFNSDWSKPENYIIPTANLHFDPIDGGEAYSVSRGTATSANIVIPSTYGGKPVKEIAADAFWHRSNITSVFIPNSVETIGYYAFADCSGLTGDLIIPNSVKTIGEVAFYGCSSLTGNLIIPDSVTTIGDSAFAYCSGFTGNLIIGNSVKTIGYRTFSYCSGLTGNLIIGNSVETIWKYAFADCSGLTGDLIIPDSVTSIGEGAFYSCINLESITINRSESEGITALGGGFVFVGCNALTSIYVPADSVDAYRNAENWSAHSGKIKAI